MDGTEDARTRVSAFLHRNVVLVTSAVLAVASMAIVPPSSDYIGYIDVRTLGILFCFMAVVAGMKECHLFGALAGRLLAGRRSLRMLGLILVMLPFFCSMLITNDVALITFVPFTILVLGMAGETRSILPVVVLQTLAANLGSMLLPFGNPQNLYIHSRYALDTGEFVLLLAPYVVVGGLVLCALCLPFSGREVHVDISRERDVRNRGLLALMGVLFVLCVLSVLRVIPWEAVLLVTVAAIVVTRRSILKGVDYGLLLTFVCLFVFTGNIAQLDVVREALEGMMSWDPMMTSLAMSQVISNVPAATLLSGFTGDWQGLLVGVDIGGFGTPIASMASMISLGFYARTEGSDMKGYLALFTAANVLMVVLLAVVYYLLRRRYLLRCTLSGIMRPGRSSRGCLGCPTAMRQNGSLSWGQPTALRTASILSSIGAMPIQHVPRPRDAAMSRMFSVAAPMSCCHIWGTVMSSDTPSGTMQSGALPTGLAYGEASDRVPMTSGSSTTTNSQACWFLAEGALMAASSSFSMSRSETLSSVKSLTLLLVKIASILGASHSSSCSDQACRP